MKLMMYAILAFAVVLVVVVFVGSCKKNTPAASEQQMTNVNNPIVSDPNYSQKLAIIAKTIKKDEDWLKVTDEQWREVLTPEQYKVLRKAGTEPAFANEYYNFHGKGIYVCAACGLELYSSEQKYDSGTGWPSFLAPITEKNIKKVEDRSLFTTRTEVLCRRCGSHIGHVFDDGPPPAGLRYCMNSVAMKFIPAGEQK
jgi:peptide-methionine (R)-S-oxide reductase